MNYITKSLTPKQSGIFRSATALGSVLVMPLMIAALIAIPAQTNALGLPDITSGLTKVLTMGKSTPAPVYTPAPSNAPAAATSTTPTATATAATSGLSAAAVSSGATTNNTSGQAATSTTIDSPTSPTSPTKYSGSEASTQTNLYKITELTASQRRLAKNLFGSSLIVGGLLLVLALITFGLRFMAGHSKPATTVRNRRSEA